jgi:hypothetical protein
MEIELRLDEFEKAFTKSQERFDEMINKYCE